MATRAMLVTASDDLSEMIPEGETSPIGAALVFVRRARAFRDDKFDAAGELSRGAVSGLPQSTLDALGEVPDSVPSQEHGPEDMPLRVKRLRAFLGDSEAVAFANAALSEASGRVSIDAPPLVEQLPQGAGDGPEQNREKPAVLLPHSPAPVDQPVLLPPVDKPEALCLLLRRTRAFLGASAAEKLAGEVITCAEQKASHEIGDKVEKAHNALPIDAVSRPTADLSADSCSLAKALSADGSKLSSSSPSPSKDSGDVHSDPDPGQIATPSRKRRISRQ